MNLEEIEIDTPRKIDYNPGHIPEVPAREIQDVKKKPGFWDKIFNKKKLQKPNTVAAIFLRNNGIAEPMELESKQGFFNIYGKTYHENRDCMWSMSKDRTPLVIIPQWSLIPLGTKRWDDKETLEKFAELQDHVLRGIRHAELVRMGGEGTGMKLNAKTIIGIIVMGIIAVAVLANYV